MEIDFTSRHKWSRVPEIAPDAYIVVCPKCKQKGAKRYPVFSTTSQPVIHRIEQFRNFNVELSKCQ
jgi:hypothetical protein